MEALTRKQREIQSRIELILQVGRDLVARHGYRGLTMNRIAELTEYSKGTIYQHFACKEEVVHSLVSKGTQRLIGMLSRTRTYKGSCRLKFTLASEAYFLFWKLYPTEISMLQTVKSSSVTEKVSPSRQQEFQNLEAKLMGEMCSTIEEGIQAGELTLPEGTLVQELAFGSWSILHGALSVSQGVTELSHVGIDNIVNSVRKNFQIYLDGCHWQPVDNDYSRANAQDIARNEIFVDEFRRLSVDSKDSEIEK